MKKTLKQRVEDLENIVYRRYVEVCSRCKHPGMNAWQKDICNLCAYKKGDSPEIEDKKREEYFMGEDKIIQIMTDNEGNLLALTKYGDIYVFQRFETQEWKWSKISSIPFEELSQRKGGE